MQPQLATPAVIDGLKSFLVSAFHGRYVTHSARRGRYAQINGAARLLATLRGYPI